MVKNHKLGIIVPYRDRQKHLKEFSRRMMKIGDSEKAHVPFHIVVPKECGNMVKEIFEKAGIPWKDSIHVIPV